MDLSGRCGREVEAVVRLERELLKLWLIGPFLPRVYLVPVRHDHACHKEFLRARCQDSSAGTRRNEASNYLVSAEVSAVRSSERYEPIVDECHCAAASASLRGNSGEAAKAGSREKKHVLTRHTEKQTDTKGERTKKIEERTSARDRDTTQKIPSKKKKKGRWWSKTKP